MSGEDSKSGELAEEDNSSLKYEASGGDAESGKEASAVKMELFMEAEAEKTTEDEYAYF